MILAPHFDDEVIGCGGVLIKYRQGRSEIKLIYLTDSSEHRLLSWRKKRHTTERQEESRKALAVLGWSSGSLVEYFNEKDGCLKDSRELNSKLAISVAEFDPNIIYTPWQEESHSDHKATAQILASTLTLIPKKDLLIAGYEAWTPITKPNFLCDISAEFELKRAAINCFKSQLKNINYARTTAGINSYRSIYNLGGEGYAEAFLVSSAREFIDSIIPN